MQVQGVKRAAAFAGEAADVGLAGIGADVLHLGATLCPPDFPVHVCRRFEVRFVDGVACMACAFAIVAKGDNRQS
jgi:hypothetical protein